MSIDLNMDEDDASKLLDLTNDVDSEELQRKKGKLSNPLWNHFQERGEERKMFCKYCPYVHNYTRNIHVDYIQKHVTVCPGLVNKLTQKTIQTIPGLNRTESEKFQQLLSEWFLETGTPFQRIEHPKLLEALKVLRFNVEIPTRKAVSGHRLTEIYANKELQVRQSLKMANGVCLTSDG